MFSTGRGRAVKVSPAALSRARQMFSGEEEKQIGDEESESGGGSGGGAVAIPSVSLGKLTGRAATIRIHDGVKRPFRSPVTGVRRARGGKENGSGADGDDLQTRAASVDTTSMRLTGGGAVQEKGVLGGGDSISETPRRCVGLSVSVNGSLGGKPTRAPFSPPLRGGRMLPPSGTVIPSSRRKPLARRVSLSDMSMTSPIDDGTPTSSKRRGLGGGSCGIQRVKRFRAPSSAVKPSLRASPKVLGGVLRGALPRPSTAVSSGDGSTFLKSPGAAVVTNTRGICENTPGARTTTEEAEVTATSEDCPATRKLFDSPARANNIVLSRKRISRRLPLSSLLNDPPLSLEDGAAESRDQKSADLNDAEASALAVAAAPPTTRIDDASEEVKAPPDAKDVTMVLKSSPEAFTCAAAREERSRSVAEVLAEVTPTTALCVRFSSVDGRPCCVDIPKGSAAGVEDEDTVEGSRGSDAGKVEREVCPHDRCCSAWDSGIALFRDDLKREGKDGSLASEIWVENHLRYVHVESTGFLPKKT